MKCETWRRIPRQARLSYCAAISLPLLGACVLEIDPPPNSTESSATTNTSTTETGAMTTEVGATLEETAALDETGEASCPEAQQCADVDCAPGAAPSHGTDIQPIWDALCTQCHFAAEPAPPGDLDLTTGVSFFSLVNVASQQSGSGLLRVSPGNPNESYLWHKIMNTHTCTTPAGDTDGMPTTDAPLSETNPDELATITEWICCGTPL